MTADSSPSSFVDPVGVKSARVVHFQPPHVAAVRLRVVSTREAHRTDRRGLVPVAVWASSALALESDGDVVHVCVAEALVGDLQLAPISAPDRRGESRHHASTAVLLGRHKNVLAAHRCDELRIGERA